ncbi:hypothetical protein [uncultured Chryseobacterium sp.]|uniref:hypothetical protein n=1 Tax=uncultured Chryseobacterium sp. TaxID=259322 RepID=UPI0025F3D3C4|nr:hypothetical protein [uncultured Chryseobacterium sp.]
MSKKTISELKEYFKATKRPTEGQFGDLLDSYVHLDATTYYRESNDFKFTFPNQQANQAIDILLGNPFINGWFEVEIAGFYNYQNTVGVIKKLLVMGANPDNDIWFPSVSRIVEASGEMVNNIYIDELVWDSNLNQYKITIYHTNSNGNDYALRLIHHSPVKSIAHEISLSSVYTKPLTGQQKHYVNYNDNLGIGTKNPKSKLQVTSSASTPDQYGTFLIGDESAPNLRMGYNQQHTWIQSHAGAPLQVNPIGNNTVFNRDGGNVGIGTDNPQSQLHLQFLNSEPKSIQFVQFTNYVDKMNAAIRYTWYNESCDVGIVRGGGTDISAYTIKFNGNEKARFAANGNAAFQGKVEAKDFVVSASPTADFVFAQDYNLRGMQDLEKFISEKQHLPEIPSAKEMTENGVTVGEFQIKLLQKIEELTLYMIAQNKELEQLKSQINNTNA